LFVYSGEFPTNYPDPGFQLIFDGYQFLGHYQDIGREGAERKILSIWTDAQFWVESTEDLSYSSESNGHEGFSVFWCSATASSSSLPIFVSKA